MGMLGVAFVEVDGGVSLPLSLCSRVLQSAMCGVGMLGIPTLEGRCAD